MNRKSITLGFATLSLALVCALSVTRVMAQEKDEDEKPAAQKAPRAKIGPVDAIRIAQGKVAGRAVQANFEFDEGHWVYGVMIAHDHKLSEVEIDPMTGKVGDVEAVTPDGEAKEVKAELSAAIK